jgi:hypothetical protein
MKLVLAGAGAVMGVMARNREETRLLDWDSFADGRTTLKSGIGEVSALSRIESLRNFAMSLWINSRL